MKTKEKKAISKTGRHSRLFAQAMGDKKDKHPAIIHSLDINLLPVFLTCFTTAIGFLSMNFSDSPPSGTLATSRHRGDGGVCLLGPSAARPRLPASV
jgi:hypothetical protein